MKKYLLGFAVMLSATLFTACMDNDNTPNKYYIPVSNGVYVVGSGNSASSIPGNLTYYDNVTKSATKNIFSKVNGFSLGNGTVNDAMRFGDKIYVVSSDENSVIVADAKTLRFLHRIELTDPKMLGEKGVTPRRITASDNKIYVSTYGGCVAAIDTASYILTKKYDVGSYPEGLMVSNGYLFVANSDYALNNSASISIVDLSTGTTETITNEDIRNPQEIAVAGSYIYYLDWGQYGEAPDYIQEHAGVYRYNIYDKKIECVIPDATGMTCYGTAIYTFNNATGVKETTYTVYDIRSGIKSNFVAEGIESPAAIAIDPLTNHLYIASYRKPSGSQYAESSSDGYVVFYDNSNSMKRVGSFECGVGPTRLAFNISIEEVEY